MNTTFRPGKVLLRREQRKFSNKSAVSQKSQIIQQIAAFIRSQGWSVAGISPASSGNETYSDLLATIAGRPVEVLVGVRRLSPSQIRYKSSIQNAGGCYAVVADRNSFKSWYCSTFKF
jgi:hypothetical protein